jgi:exoribonuclease R
VVTHEDGEWVLSFRAPLPIERWNAQISLLTGMVAADLMLSAGVGILRTMPPPEAADLARVRRTAKALGLQWPQNGSYADLIRSADPEQPAHLAFLSLATTLLRGAGYTTRRRSPRVGQPFGGGRAIHARHGACGDWWTGSVPRSP